MHELTLASNILNITRRVARENALSRVTRITVKVGVWSCVNEESLKFALSCIANEPWIKGVNLKVEKIGQGDTIQEMYIESIEGEKNEDKSIKAHS
ncbi:MAG: hydrogenase maturation nickel metallochaperone HypA [Caldiserica bacterium]|nr:hydrogenase maturation nickel metallochaperone HypA [Caldisericota bacterium]